MNGSKHNSNVVLFPLCDARGLLMDALRSTDNTPTTRSDALVFAWRLELPRGVDVAKAAATVLHVALLMPRKKWSRQQLVIIRELMVLGGRNSALADVNIDNMKSLGKSDVPRKVTAKRHSRRATDTPVRQVGEGITLNTYARKPIELRRTEEQMRKENSSWWHLVGGHSEDT